MVTVSGCQTPLCYDSGIDPSGRYVATIVEPYTAQSSFTYDSKIAAGTGAPSCGSIDGLESGATVEFQGTGTVDDRTQTCKLIVAKLVSVPAEIMPGDGSAQAEETFAAAQVSDNGLIRASEEVTLSGCSGGYAVEVLAGGQLSALFDTPTPGQLPPAVLFRLFQPVSTSSCQQCEDSFVIQFSKE